jgi:hypothetical protein
MTRPSSPTCTPTFAPAPTITKRTAEPRGLPDRLAAVAACAPRGFSGSRPRPGRGRVNADRKHSSNPRARTPSWQSDRHHPCGNAEAGTQRALGLLRRVILPSCACAGPASRPSSSRSWRSRVRRWRRCAGPTAGTPPPSFGRRATKNGTGRTEDRGRRSLRAPPNLRGGPEPGRRFTRRFGILSISDPSHADAGSGPAAVVSAPGTRCPASVSLREEYAYMRSFFSRGRRPRCPCRKSTRSAPSLRARQECRRRLG